MRKIFYLAFFVMYLSLTTKNEMVLGIFSTALNQQIDTTSNQINDTFPTATPEERQTSMIRTERAIYSHNRFTMEEDSTATYNPLTENETDATTSRTDIYEIPTSTTEHTTSMTEGDDPCYEYSSCFISRFCQCDVECEKFDDCCLGHNKTQTNNDSMNYGCIRRSNVVTDIIGFTSINDCPTDYDNSTVTEKCQHSNMAEHGLPVVDRHGMVYKNIYCAECRNVVDVDLFDIQFTDFRMTQKALSQFLTLTRENKFSLALKHASYVLRPPPNTKFRTCIPDVIEGDHHLCKQYLNPVAVGNRRLEIYRNYFCIPIDKRNIARVCARDLKIIFRGEMYTMSVIFSFKKQDQDHLKTAFCEHWTVEMETKNNCKHLETYTNVTIEVEYYMVSNVSLTFSEMETYVILSAWAFEISNFSEIVRKIKMESNQDNTVVKVYITVKILKRSFNHEIKNTKMNFQERMIDIFVTDTNSSARINIKSQIRLTMEQENTTGTFVRTRIIRLQLSSISDLVMRKIDLGNYSIHTLSDQLKITLLQGTNDLMYIESILYANVSSGNIPTTSPLTIITYSCFSVSIFALLCLIIYNRKQGHVSSIPFSNLENLSVTLLLSNLLFMVGIGAYNVSKLCYVVGVTLHYLWLTVFSFMTISVVYIVKNIVHLKSRQTRRSETTRRRKCQITIVGLIIPLFFVGPALVVDKFGPRTLSPGYGGKVCFPNRFPANIIFFSGPVIVSIAVNLVCLVTIIAQICRIRLEIRHIRKSEQYKDAKMYFRLVILSGIFWVTGILAVLYENKELEYVFTVLCGLHGFSIAVANLTTSSQCRQKDDSFNS